MSTISNNSDIKTPISFVLQIPSATHPNPNNLSIPSAIAATESQITPLNRSQNSAFKPTSSVVQIPSAIHPNPNNQSAPAAIAAMKSQINSLNRSQNSAFKPTSSVVQIPSAIRPNPINQSAPAAIAATEPQITSLNQSANSAFKSKRAKSHAVPAKPYSISQQPSEISSDSRSSIINSRADLIIKSNTENMKRQVLKTYARLKNVEDVLKRPEGERYGVTYQGKSYDNFSVTTAHLKTRASAIVKNKLEDTNISIAHLVSSTIPYTDDKSIETQIERWIGLKKISESKSVSHFKNGDAYKVRGNKPFMHANIRININGITKSFQTARADIDHKSRKVILK